MATGIGSGCAALSAPFRFRCAATVASIGTFVFEFNTTGVARIAAEAGAAAAHEALRAEHRQRVRGRSELRAVERVGEGDRLPRDGHGLQQLPRRLVRQLAGC